MHRIVWISLLLLHPRASSAQWLVDSTRVAELISILHERHFAPRSIDDRFSADVHDTYLRVLDPDTLFLSLAERSALASHRLRIDEQLAHGVPAFVLHSDSLMHAGLQRAMALLERPDDPYPPIDILARWNSIVSARSTALRSAMNSTKEDALALVRARLNKDLSDRIARGRSERMELFLATLANVHDAQSTYLSPTERAGFENAMTQSFVGVGIALSIDGAKILIDGLEPGGPAEQCGAMAVGDELIAIRTGGAPAVPVLGLSIAETVELLRGPAGSSVELLLRKVEGGVQNVPITRARIQPEAGRAQARILRSDQAPIGLISLPRFYTDLSGGNGPRCYEDFTELLDSLLLAGISGLIIDLRDNQGGSMSETIHILGLFLDAAPVAQRLARDGTVRVLSTTATKARYRGPLVVLVNERSASASEFFAAALQDHQRAVIMGAPCTYGKGTIQALVDLTPTTDANGELIATGSAKITVGLFFRPSGSSVQLNGVTPDIVIGSAASNHPSGERALPFALKHEGIGTCAITPWNAEGLSCKDLISRAAQLEHARAVPVSASTVRASWSTQAPKPETPFHPADPVLDRALPMLQEVAQGAVRKLR